MLTWAAMGPSDTSPKAPTQDHLAQGAAPGVNTPAGSIDAETVSSKPAPEPQVEPQPAANPSATSPVPKPVSLADEDSSNPFSREILAAHNAARSARDAKPLTWSTEMADQAQDWAEKCVFKHGGTTGGQNLAASSAGQSADGVLNSWISEEKDYYPAQPSYDHFTQVVWKSSMELGCYQTKCVDNFRASSGSFVFGGSGQASYTVCNYNPPVRGHRFLDLHHVLTIMFRATLSDVHLKMCRRFYSLGKCAPMQIGQLVATTL